MASVDLQEKANFTRLSRLLIDKGTEALRNTFDAIHASVNLPAVLNVNQKSLLRLKFRVINNSQWDLLFPPSAIRQIPKPSMLHYLQSYFGTFVAYQKQDGMQCLETRIGQCRKIL
jgi:hypothetical protein